MIFFRTSHARWDMRSGTLESISKWWISEGESNYRIHFWSHQKKRPGCFPWVILLCLFVGILSLIGIVVSLLYDIITPCNLPFSLGSIYVLYPLNPLQNHLQKRLEPKGSGIPKDYSFSGRFDLQGKMLHETHGCDSLLQQGKGRWQRHENNDEIACQRWLFIVRHDNKWQ